MHGLRRHPSRCHCKGPETQRKLKQGLGNRSPLKDNHTWRDTFDNIQDVGVIFGNAPVIGGFFDGANALFSAGRAGYEYFQGDTDEAKRHLKEAGYNALAFLPNTQTLTSVRTADKIRKKVKDIKKTNEVIKKANDETKDPTTTVTNEKPGQPKITMRRTNNINAG